MKSVFISIVFLQSCTAFQPVAEDIKEVLNNDAITIKVDKDAIQKDTDVSVKVDVTNKEVTQ